jgi:hypothetical protein
MKVYENSSSHVTVEVNLPSVEGEEGEGAGSATEEEEGRCREILSMQNANPAKLIQQRRQQTT